MGWLGNINIAEIIGKTMLEVTKIKNEEIIFKADDGSEYKMYHSQDCCENVVIEDVVGDLCDLIGSPILRAEERTNKGPDVNYGTSTYTFYEIATNKGSVTVRWFGESNGYYSEDANFARIK